MRRSAPKAGGRLQRAQKYIAADVWDVELSSLSSIRRLGVKVVRIAYLVVKGFFEDQCPLHASALTFSTLMSLVPVLAVSLALARGLGAGDNLETQLKAFVHDKLGVEAPANDAAGRTDAAAPDDGSRESDGMTAEQFAARVDGVLNQIFDSVRNVSFTKLGGAGLLILVFSVVQVLGRVESSFNRVWGVTASRPIHRKVLDYLPILLVVPLFAAAASSLPVAHLIASYLHPSAAKHVLDLIGSVRFQGLFVFAMVTLAFTFLLMFMPNTRVKTSSGLGGALVTALLFLVWMKLCIAIQVGVAKYSKIYGGFAVVPILLFWVYVSWEIILLGAEVAFAIQNCNTYRMEMQSHSASARSRFILALDVVREAARAMLGAAPTFDASAYARARDVPVRLLNQVLRELVDAGLMTEMSEQEGRFVLMRPPDKISVKDVFDVVFRAGSNPEDFGISLDESVNGIIGRTDAGIAEAFARQDVKGLAETC